MLQHFSNFFPRNEENALQIGEIRPDAEAMLGTPIHALPYSLFTVYSETGSRVEYEACYMEHRRRLWIYSAMFLWEDDPRWKKELCDIIVAICEESFWAFPAHLKKTRNYRERRTSIDLFASETSQALAEIRYLAGNRLPEAIREMILENIRERIIRPYLAQNRNYGNSNWSAVCNGNVAISMMELDESESFTAARGQIVRGLTDFLSGYLDDGCCMEGILYWTYGFGYFIYAAAMLREYTGGEIDLLSEPKVARIAEFRDKCFFEGPHTVPIADASHLLYLQPGLASFLHDEFSTPLLSRDRIIKYGYDTRWRFADMIRTFYWGKPPVKESLQRSTYLMEGAQWLVGRRDRFCFAVKGGHNDEPHNHNDIGSFLFYVDGNYIADDFGWPEYDAGYFTDRRYLDYICASSLGHNVPILDGKAQLGGREHASRLVALREDLFEADLSAAYGAPEGTLLRRVEVSRDGLTVTDTVAPGHSVVENISTRIPPEIDGSTVRIAGSVIYADGCTVELQTAQFDSRSSIGVPDLENPVTAYLLRLTPRKDVRRVVITVRRSDKE